MFIFNLPQNMAPMRTARGVDPKRTQVQPARPRFMPKPLDNHMAMQLGPTDESIMGYGPQGTFTSTALSVESRKRAMAQMGRDNSLINMVNDTRKGRRF